MDNATIELVTPSGSVATFSIDDAQRALAQGYRPPTPEEQAAITKFRQFSTTGEKIKTFAEGALGSLAPVVGPAAERAVFDNAEEQRSRAEVNPGVHAAGAVTGAIAPLPFTGGAGLLGQAARLSAPAQIARAGEAIGAGVRGATAVSRITAAVADQAAQGALYTGSDVLNRAVVQDPKLTAESAAAEIGLGALIGGGAGALTGALGKLAEGHGKDLVETLRGMEADRNVKAAGAIQSTIKRTLKQIPEERLDDIARYWGKEGLVGPFKSFDAMQEGAERTMAQAVTDMEAIKQAASRVQTQHQTYMADVVNAIGKDPVVVRLGQDPTQVTAYQQLQDLLARYVDKFAAKDAAGNVIGHQPLSVLDLHEMRQQLGRAARGWAGSMDPYANATREALDRARVAVSKQIDLDIERAGLSSAAWKDANFRWQAGNLLSEYAEIGAARAHGNNLISPMEALGTIGGALQHGSLAAGTVTGAATALVRREGSATAGWALRHLADFIEGVQSRTQTTVAAEVKRLFAGAEGATAAQVLERKIPALTVVEFPQRAAELNQHANDPERFAQTVEQHLGPVVSSAAPVAAHLAMTAQNAAQHLASIVPAQPKVGPLDRDYTISDTELAQFNRHWEVANDPMAVLRHLSQGTLTQDHVAGLSAMYPALENQIRLALGEKLAEQIGSGKDVPYHLRFGLSQLLGIDLDRSLSGPTIAAAQMAYANPATPPSQQQPAPGPRIRSSVKLTGHERMASATQGLAQRLP